MRLCAFSILKGRGVEYGVAMMLVVVVVVQWWWCCLYNAHANTH